MKLKYLLIPVILLGLAGPVQAAEKIDIAERDPAALLELIAQKQKQEQAKTDKAVAAAPTLADLSEANKLAAAILAEDALKTAQEKSEAKGLSLTKRSPKGEIPWLRTILAFVFVASLIVLLASFVNKKLSQNDSLLRRALGTNAVKSLKLLNQISLGFKRQVALVDVGGTQLVLGVTGQSVTLLHIKAPEAVMEESHFKITETPPADREIRVQDIPAPARKPAPARESFSNRVRSAVGSLKPLSAEGNSRKPAFNAAERLLTPESAPSASYETQAASHEFRELELSDEASMTTVSYSSDGGFSSEASREEPEVDNKEFARYL